MKRKREEKKGINTRQRLFWWFLMSREIGDKERRVEEKVEKGELKSGDGGCTQ